MKKNQKIKKEKKQNKKVSANKPALTAVSSQNIKISESKFFSGKKQEIYSQCGNFYKRTFSKKNLLLYIPPLSLIIILLFLTFLNINIKESTDTDKLSLHKTPVFSLSNYPLISSVLASNDLNKYSYAENPNLLKDIELNNFENISAQAAIIMDDDSKVILFSKNENLRFSMASTTKVMTALAGLDYFKLDDILTIRQSKVEGSAVGFKQGDNYYFEDLLYAMLLPSGNDAALAIAQNYPGGEKEFIKKMNEKAESINLFNTHFSDSSGLDDYGDYTTVKDLAILSSMALKNPVIQKIVSTQEKIITNVNGNKTFSLSNLNKLLGINGINGIKTGYTEEAEGVLATSKMENGHRLIIIVMKSQNRFLDTQNLLSLVEGKIKYVKIGN